MDSTMLPLKYSFSSACKFPNRGFSDMQPIIISSSSVAAFAAALQTTPLRIFPPPSPPLFLAAVHGCGDGGTVFLNDVEPPHAMRLSSIEFLLNSGSTPTGSPSSNLLGVRSLLLLLIVSLLFAFSEIVEDVADGGDEENSDEGPLFLCTPPVCLNSSTSSVGTQSRTPLEHLE
ncbi:hypothetical protein OROMI_005214 [Orobanche minor]